MTSIVFLINGPNFNLLGKRQPEVYGATTLEQLENECARVGATLGLEVRCRQSNAEHEIIGWIHEARETARAIIINPAAFSHTSIAILDALNAFDGIVLEIHVSNIHKRESFRHHSYVSLRADGVIAGFGTQGYALCLQRLANLLETSPKS